PPISGRSAPVSARARRHRISALEAIARSRRLQRAPGLHADAARSGVHPPARRGHLDGPARGRDDQADRAGLRADRPLPASGKGLLRQEGAARPHGPRPAKGRLAPVPAAYRPRLDDCGRCPRGAPRGRSHPRDRLVGRLGVGGVSRQPWSGCRTGETIRGGAAVMTPVILVADDDPKSLASLSEALTRRYGADYRVVSAASGPAGLEELGRIREGGEKVALLIADQWMPEMPGLEFMTRAHVIHPAAQRALLVDWGDQTAAPAILRGCAFGQLENYIRKPWSPPEVHLYPAIGELLGAWTRAHGPRMELVRVVGEDASRRTHEVRMFLDRSGIPHGFYEAGSEEGLAVLRGVGVEVPRLPVVILLDGPALRGPSRKGSSHP